MKHVVWTKYSLTKCISTENKFPCVSVKIIKMSSFGKYWLCIRVAPKTEYKIVIDLFFRKVEKLKIDWDTVISNIWLFLTTLLNIQFTQNYASTHTSTQPSKYQSDGYRKWAQSVHFQKVNHNRNVKHQRETVNFVNITNTLSHAKRFTWKRLPPFQITQLFVFVCARRCHPFSLWLSVCECMCAYKSARVFIILTFFVAWNSHIFSIYIVASNMVWNGMKRMEQKPPPPPTKTIVRTMNVCGSKWNSTKKKKKKELDEYNENVIKTRVHPAPAPVRKHRDIAPHTIQNKTS